MSTLLRRNKLPSGLCVCVLAFVTAVSFLSCNDVSVGSGECPGVNEFLDRISGNDKKSDTAKPVIVDAAVPSITEHPLNGTADVGTPHRIFVNASVEDGGTLQYQWYSNVSMSNVGGWLINGAIDSVYTVPTFGEGTFYYYVMVTNVNSKVNGNVTATARSGVAAITVGSVTNASAPNITADPVTQNVFAEEGGSVQLSVAALSPDGGTLSYQWYLSINGSNFDGIMIPDAVEPSYTVSTSAAGISHYYVVVTNTNTEVNGLHTAVSISRTAAVMVTVEGVENAAVPTINLIDDINVKTGESVVLNVTASVTDGGTLSYQWYHQIFENDWVWLPIEGETGISYSVPTSAAGGSHYYVVVTNVNSEVNGEQIMQGVSNLVTVVVNAIVDAQEPEILMEPASTITITKDTEESISVVAAGVSDGGILSYQWYHQINQEWQPIEDAVYSSYIVPTSTVGKFNYFVIVTNTNIHVNGKTTASVTSQTSIVTIAELNINDAQAPRITEQTLSGTVIFGGTRELFVTADVTDGGTLSYQWFSNETASNTGGTAIPEATQRFYTVSTIAPRVFYYYVVVTNTNNSVNGKTTESTPSRVVTITVVQTFELVINSNPTIGGNSYSSNSAPTGNNGNIYNVNSGASVHIKAEPANGYRFVNWKGDQATFGNVNQANTTVTITGNTTIQANFESIYGSLIDTRDGKSQTYRTVVIGGRTWMADNLNYDGTLKNDSSWCYGDSYDQAKANCDKYGRLYNWNAAVKACPSGWRLPNNDDWESLRAVAGNISSNLKSSPPDWNGTNNYGFSALPGGVYNGLEKRFEHDPTGSDRAGLWWATDLNRWMISNNNNLMDKKEAVDERHGHSVRCVQ